MELAKNSQKLIKAVSKNKIALSNITPANVCASR